MMLRHSHASENDEEEREEKATTTTTAAATAAKCVLEKGLKSSGKKLIVEMNACCSEGKRYIKRSGKNIFQTAL